MECSEKRHFEWVQQETTTTNNSRKTLVDLGVDLHFISETGVARPRGPFRDLIRSKARRKVTHRKYPINEVESRPSVEVCGRSEDASSSRNQGVHSSSDLARYIASVNGSGPERGVLDQFSAHFSEKGRGQYYIHLYLKVFKHTYPQAMRGTMNKKETVLRIALEEPALMHALLSHSALGATSLRAEPSRHDQFYHKGEAIRLINERIGGIIRNGTASNGILGAVTSMAHFEIRLESQSCLREHMNGIEILVGKRGGLQTISDEAEEGKDVTWFLAWTDFCAAIALNEAPRFAPVIESHQPHLKDLPPYNASTLRLQADLLKFTDLEELAREVADFYWHLRNLKPILPTEAAKLVDTGQSLIAFEYKIRLEALERRAIFLSQSTSSVVDSTEASAGTDMLIYRLIGSAALIHILLFLRESPSSVPLSYILARRMREMLQAPGVDIATLLVRLPKLLVWVFLMGGFGGLGSQNSDVDVEFFSQMFGRCCKSLTKQNLGSEIGTVKVDGKRHGSESESGHEGRAEGVKEDVERFLRGFMWLDSYKASSMKGFWNQV